MLNFTNKNVRWINNPCISIFEFETQDTLLKNVIKAKRIASPQFHECTFNS